MKVRKRRPEPDPIREGLLQAVQEMAEAGGVVLVGHDGKPFAFYPPRRPPPLDPGAPKRLRELVERRLEELAACNAVALAHCMSDGLLLLPAPQPVGNHGCGHRKDHPLLYIPPPEHKPRPHPLCNLEKQNELIYKLLRKKRRTSSPRRIRSESRDAAQVACCCAIHYLDRKTMTIQIPGEKGAPGVGVGYALIAKQTQMRYRRVQRAFKVLYEIGWVVAERAAMRLDNGQLLWLPSMRQFTRALFLALKKAPWYDSWTGRTRKKAEKKARAAEAEAKAKEAPRDDDPLGALFKPNFFGGSNLTYW